MSTSNRTEFSGGRDPGGQRHPPSGLGAVLRSLFTELLDTVLPGFVMAVLINLFLAQSTYVHGQSMEPNLHSDQRLIVEKVSYRLHAPRRGDIVVIRLDEYEIPLIKRVVGLPGETVEIRDNGVLIDGVPLGESYLSGVVQRNYGPVQVPLDHVFVMGDNRDVSSDSRVFGAVHVDRIAGRAWLSYWPLSDIALFP